MPRAYRCCPEPGVAAEEWNNTRTQRQSGHHKRQLRYKKLLVYDDPYDDIARFFDESSTFIQKVTLLYKGVLAQLQQDLS